jgi:hypothetical protein
MQIDTWEKCYPSNWSGHIVPDAITHPAKYSSKLIRKIYEHIIDEGWAERGDYVIDPFAGVSLGALDAMRHGLIWRGVELERSFCDLGQANINLWNDRFSTMPGWSGDAMILEGDSRFLGEIITLDPKKFTTVRGRWKNNLDKIHHYGETHGQLANMPATSSGFSISLSSPPFRQTSGGVSKPKPGGTIDARLQKRHSAGNAAAAGYGLTPGQLSNMKDGDFSLSISSPPYKDTNVSKNRQFRSKRQSSRPAAADLRVSPKTTYEDNPDQLGASGDFWPAAREIVDQVFYLLKPGGHALWVVKDFVRNGQIVPFCDQWRQVCEAAGFVLLHEHHASLVRHNGSSLTLDGGVVDHIKSSKSFFRRIQEAKGSPPIDYETVFCMLKPAE